MSRSRKALFIGCILAGFGFCGGKDREWKTGRVLDSATSKETHAVGVITNPDPYARSGGQSPMPATATIQNVTIQSNELLIVGEQYSYVIEDSTRQGGPILARKLANRKRGCRFIVGEDVKYSQEKGDLWVLDADGKECRLPIIRQQKRS